MTENLAVFFDAAEHATAATLDGDSVVGIFENRYVESLGAVAAAQPTYTLPTADAAAAAQGSALVIGATSYTVRNIQPDGTGVTTLELQLA